MQQSKNHALERKTVDIGQYISESLAETLRSTYAESFPDTMTSFVIDKSLIEQALGLSSKVAGVRFMYGLRDMLNPNSVSVILVPCTSRSVYSQNTMPLISEQGYYDHLGTQYHLLETAELIANFIQSQNTQDPQLVYKTTTRGNFIGRNSLVDLLKDQACQSISYTLGLEEKTIQPILQALDSNEEPINNLYMERSQPCPPFCHDDSDCLARTVVELFSGEEELNQFRQFRDEVLLHTPGGSYLYETYYFISPIITNLIRKRVDGKQVFQMLYTDKILPFKQLINTGETTTAVLFLKETLINLAQEYPMELVE
ncbi:MAG: hypothetical protein HRU41_00055 [Saprospiraceae bacterium]|nr:hypothetical protein [Saprospiraceae bacterium]